MVKTTNKGRNKYQRIRTRYQLSFKYLHSIDLLTKIFCTQTSLRSIYMYCKDL